MCSLFQRLGKPEEMRMHDLWHSLATMRKALLYLVARTLTLRHQYP